MDKNTIMVSALAEGIELNLLLTVVLASLKELDNREKKQKPKSVESKEKKDELSLNIKVKRGKSVSDIYASNVQIKDISKDNEFYLIRRECFKKNVDYAVIRNKTPNKDKKYCFTFLFAFENLNKFLNALDTLEVFYKNEFNKIEREKRRQARREAREQRKREIENGCAG